MLQRLGGRNLGSESSAWAALVVLGGIQYSFNFIAPHLLRWVVPYAALATCLCLFAIGIAIAIVFAVIMAVTGGVFFSTVYNQLENPTVQTYQ